jgi:glycosyltransferase involved in cell wall biosynthesis
MLSVVIPCYNEKNNIEEIVRRVLASPIKNKEIIIVDDCSKDGTREILTDKIEPLVSKVLFRSVNGGKGASLKTGIQAATGDVVIMQDADQEYDPMEYEKIVTPIFEDKADVVYGSRFKDGVNKGFVINRLANWFLTKLSNFFTGLECTDMETCYKAFKREIIQSIDIQEKRFGFEPEVTAKIAAKKVRFKEVSVSYNPRTKKEGKKIGWRDGFRTMYCIWKYRA